MTIADIEERIIFNARLIAQEIDDTEYVQKYGGSDYAKESAKISAYEHIAEMIYGEEQG